MWKIYQRLWAIFGMDRKQEENHCYRIEWIKIWMKNKNKNVNMRLSSGLIDFIHILLVVAAHLVFSMDFYFVLFP